MRRSCPPPTRTRPPALWEPGVLEPAKAKYYAEPKRLASLGYLEARKEPGKTRERPVYALTGKGREALSEWAKTPVTFTPLKSKMLTRMLIADLVGEEPTRESILTLRDDISDLVERLDEAEASAKQIQHRSKYLLLSNAFLRRLLDLHLEWIDEVEHELAPSRQASVDTALAEEHNGAPSSVRVG